MAEGEGEKKGDPAKFPWFSAISTLLLGAIVIVILTVPNLRGRLVTSFKIGMRQKDMQNDAIVDQKCKKACEETAGCPGYGVEMNASGNLACFISDEHGSLLEVAFKSEGNSEPSNILNWFGLSNSLTPQNADGGALELDGGALELDGGALELDGGALELDGGA